jgi:hypothetical protein
MLESNPLGAKIRNGPLRINNEIPLQPVIPEHRAETVDYRHYSACGETL